MAGFPRRLNMMIGLLEGYSDGNSGGLVLNLVNRCPVAIQLHLAQHLLYDVKSLTPE